MARLVIQKTAVGGSGTFNYASTGGLSPATFALSPVLPGTPTVSQTFSNLVPGAYSVTETAALPFRLTDISCIASGASASGSTISTSPSTGLVSATLVAGADYTCTYINVRDADVAIIKTTVGGDNTFGFTTTGSGNPSDPAPSITTTSGTGAAAFVVPFDVSNPSRTVTVSENTPPTGWVLTSIACVNGLGVAVGTVVLPTVTIVATPGESFNCRFNNARLPRVTIVKRSVNGTGTFNFTGGTNGLPATLALDTSAANPALSTTYDLLALATDTSISETIPSNYVLTSAVCTDGGGTPVSTTLAAGTVTIAAAAVIGGLNLTCTFTNTRKSAQISFNKRWMGAIVGNQVTLSSTGATNNPTLVATANSANEVDAGTAVTVYAGETLTLSEAFGIGSASSYSQALSCTGATDTDPSNGLAIAATDNGATIVCTWTNARIPNVTKTASTVTGPNAAGVYTANYSVVVNNPGAAGSYGPLTDTTNFASNIEVLGASWTATATAGVAPSGGSSTGSGAFDVAPASQAISANSTHTFSVAVSFRFTSYTSPTACGGPGTGLYNSVSVATPELTTSDNNACDPPPAPPAPAIAVTKSAVPTTVTTIGQLVTYTMIVKNTGNVNLTSIGVTDALAGLSAVTCLTASLAPNATTSCTATYHATLADMRV